MTFITLNKRKKSLRGTYSSFQSLVSSCFRHRQLARAAQRSAAHARCRRWRRSRVVSAKASSNWVLVRPVQLGDAAGSAANECGSLGLHIESLAACAPRHPSSVPRAAVPRNGRQADLVFRLWNPLLASTPVVCRLVARNAAFAVEWLRCC
ncbi:uncharacterized protein BKA78DRAFT_70296 [Phyllosticta capitalensis]|uniref:uncharacterized protein n=1 Tax=Phyllosticta capitalensis TaxID=121624 RepID=UPI00312F1556